MPMATDRRRFNRIVKMAASLDYIGSSRDYRSLRRKIDRIEEVDISAKSCFLRFDNLTTVRYAFRERNAALIAREQPLIWEVSRSRPRTNIRRFNNL